MDILVVVDCQSGREHLYFLSNFLAIESYLRMSTTEPICLKETHIGYFDVSVHQARVDHIH